MPGDLHKLWRTRDPKGYQVEYGYSCMGYEVAGGLGVKMEYDMWWDVPVAEVSDMQSVRDARRAYEQARRSRRWYL
jgi:TPP-dependent trihydroxycyclohexane-1,2-dione (THcHDO) dehydratase